MIYKTTEEIFEGAAIGEWLDCQFTDNESGETFFVELQKEDGESVEDFIAKCQEVADEYFSDAEYDCLCDNETAEVLGYDTY